MFESAVLLSISQSPCRHPPHPTHTYIPTHMRMSQYRISSTGRDLARTRWMDQASGDEFNAPWHRVRAGASCDDISLTVKDIIVECKRFEKGKSPQGRLLEQLRRTCRVVGFSWRPCLASNEEWGGDYGKCCGHNEVRHAGALYEVSTYVIQRCCLQVCMQFVRPFHPQEVINTRVCSEASPAPGYRR